MTLEVLKKSILKKVEEYYKLAHGTKANFVPGKTWLPYAGRVFDENEMVSLIDSALEFWLTYGRYSKQFETKMSKCLGVKHVLLVNSGSSANLLAFSALTSYDLGDRRINRGDEVITVGAGFPTTVSPIIQHGAVPVFVDVDIETLNIDVDLLESARSDKTKAVMIAHTLGNPFNIEKVKDFCDQNKLWLIEDNCDALGAKYNGKHTGTFGDIGTSSFYPPHHITMGEGGAVYTNSTRIAMILASFRDWGRDCYCDSGKDNSCGKRFKQKLGSLPYGYDHKYVYSHFGYNLKPTDLQAAIGCAQLDKLDGFITARNDNYNYYKERLAKFEDQFIFTKSYEKASPSWFGFLMTIRDNSKFKREDLVRHLEEAKIQTRNLFAGNITKQPCFDNLSKNVDFRIVGKHSNTDKIMTDSFWIGVYPGLTKEMQDYVVDSFEKFF